MKYPQTLAIKIAKNIQTIADNACCAFTTLWIFGLDPENAEAIEIISDAIDARVIEKDCTVKWVEFAKWLTGRDIEIEFRDIKSLNEIKNEKSRIAVRFDYAGKCHWIGVYKGKIEYNSKINSICVTKGRPTTCRIIRLARR